MCCGVPRDFLLGEEGVMDNKGEEGVMDNKGEEGVMDNKGEEGVMDNKLFPLTVCMLPSSLV